MPKDKEIAVTEMTIKIGKKELKLSPDDAHILYDALGKMFNEKIVYRDGYYRPLEWTYCGTTTLLAGHHDTLTISNDSYSTTDCAITATA